MRSQIHKSWNLVASIFFPIITLLFSAPLLGHALHLFIMHNNHTYDNAPDYHNYHTRPRVQTLISLSLSLPCSSSATPLRFLGHDGSASPIPKCFKAEYPSGQRKWEQYQMTGCCMRPGKCELERVNATLGIIRNREGPPLDTAVIYGRHGGEATIRDYYDMWRNELSVLYYDYMTCQLKIIKSPMLRKWWQLGVFFSSITCLLN
ncbi:unnamed protein product [Brassica napus]|uniref:Uncharacterized protein n=2 Tax=Brassica TaxID=3705 RepID=A0A0D3DAA3_BRAOL|nr:PREDICTED: tetraspanin-14 [Brassica oleracea var. oleracea]CAF1999144.1 unnamed protein product [Brassica napus]